MLCVVGEKFLMFFFRQKTPKCALGERGREGAGGGNDLPFVLRTLILKNNTWNFLGFFFEPANFFMNAAPTT
jgi:hypothetical protein